MRLQPRQTVTVATLVVDVYEYPFHLIQPFQFDLERLADVVRLSDCHRFRQNDDHLDEVLAAEVECLDVVDIYDSTVMLENQTGEHVDELCGSRESGQHSNLICLMKNTEYFQYNA